MTEEQIICMSDASPQVSPISTLHDGHSDRKLFLCCVFGLHASGCVSD